MPAQQLQLNDPPQMWAHDLAHCLRTGHMLPGKMDWRDRNLLPTLTSAHLFDFGFLLSDGDRDSVRESSLFPVIYSEFERLLFQEECLSTLLPYPACAFLSRFDPQRRTEGPELQRTPGSLLMIVTTDAAARLVIWACLRYVPPSPLAQRGWYPVGHYTLEPGERRFIVSPAGTHYVRDGSPVDPHTDLPCDIVAIECLAILNSRQHAVQIDVEPPPPSHSPLGRPWREYEKPAPTISLVRIGVAQQPHTPATAAPLYHTCPHDRRGHQRRLPSGRVIWVRPCAVNGGANPRTAKVVRLAR